jgi:hypothetical protein
VIPLGKVICGELRMMGRREGEQGQFLYSFHLDKVVPPDHLVRKIDGLLDLDWGAHGVSSLLLAHGPAFD